MRKSKILKIGTLVLALCLLLSVPTLAISFNSSETSWQRALDHLAQDQAPDDGQEPPEYSDSVDYVRENGIMRGDENGNLNLNAAVKRGDMALMLVRAFNMNSNVQGPDSNNGNGYGNGNGNFADVSSDSYYCNAIATIKNLGVARGDGTNYMPESYITIEEAIALIERSIAKVDSSMISGTAEGLEALFSSRDFSDYATREDVADMLYYILSGNVSDDDSGTGTVNTIAYSVSAGFSVDFDGDDFIAVCDAVSDEDLSYVKFTLPSSVNGTLYYYDDTAVTASMIFYADDACTQAISDVSFLACSAVSGTIAVNYRAYNDDGDYLYTGSVYISIENSIVDTITYTVSAGSSVDFNEDDFIAVCDAVSDEDLSYVKFAQPSGTYGTLYYDDDTAITASMSFYANNDYTQAISDVSFLAGSLISGTTAVTYRAYNGDGNYLYTGSVYVTIENDTVDAIAYAVSAGSSVDFDVDDFVAVCSAISDEDLLYVKFTLPSSTYGTLYYDDDTAVTDSMKFFADEVYTRAISDVSFLADSSVSGTMTITYRAYDGNAAYLYTGTVYIVIID